MSAIIQNFATGAALIEGLWDFLCNKGHSLAPVYTGVGNGYVDDCLGTSTSVLEVLTVTLTSATTFTVAGSVNGALGTGTVGTLFTCSLASFTVMAGSTAWAAGDTIALTMTPPWKSKIHSAGSTYAVQPPGNDGNGSNVCIDLACSSNGTTNYFNAQISATPWWDDSRTLTDQYSRRDYTLVWPLGPSAGQACTLIAVADGRFCYAVCQIGSVYTAACFGLMQAFHSEVLHPSPLLIGGSALSHVQWINSGVRSPMYPPVNSAGSRVPSFAQTVDSGGWAYLYAFLPPGRWAGLNGQYSGNSEASGDCSSIVLNRDGSKWRTNLDDTVPGFPIYVMNNGQNSVNPEYKLFSGMYGVVPFAKIIPCYKADGSLISGGVIFRDATSRRRIITIQNGYVVDASNTYGLELA